MANPVDTGLAETWITDRLPADTLAPKSGNTGTFDRWLTDRLTFGWYTEKVTATVSSSVTADAVSLRVASVSILADATVLVVEAASFTVDACIERVQSDSIAASGTVRTEIAGIFAADAKLVRSVTGSIVASGAIRFVSTATIVVDAYLLIGTVVGTLSADAVVLGVLSVEVSVRIQSTPTVVVAI